MKTVVVYFSLENNTKYLADYIAKELNAKVIRLFPVKEYPTGKVSKYFWGGKSVTFGERPKLETYQFNANDYDLVILGTPIWEGTFTPPLRTFLKQVSMTGKKVAFFASCSGGSTERCFAQLEKEIPNCTVLATLRIVDPTKNQNAEENNKIIDFCATLKAHFENKNSRDHF